MATNWDDFEPVDPTTAKRGKVDWSQFEPVKPDNTSNFRRGLNESFQQLPQLGYGLVAGAGAALESAVGEGGFATGLKKAGVKGYQEWSDKIESKAKESDSFDYSWDKAKEGDFGALSSWLAHGIGYAGGQAIQALATGGIGYAGGKVALGQVAETVASGLVKKEAARLAASGVTKDLAADQVTRLATQNVAAKIGQTAAIGANAFGMEGGEIFGDLSSEADKEGRALSGSELAKAFGATLAAGGLEFVGDKIGLDVMLGKSKLLKPTEALQGVKGRIARGAVAGAGAMPIEGGTEYGQTLIEEYGKGHDPLSEESFKQASEAAALGALGGAVMGGVGGAMHGAKPRPIDKAMQAGSDVLSAPTIDEAISAASQSVLKTKPDNLTPGLREDMAMSMFADQARQDQMAVRASEPPATIQPIAPARVTVPPESVPERDVAELIPTGDAAEIEPIPVGDAAEMLPTPDVIERPKKIPVGFASEADESAVETIHADDIPAFTDLKTKDGQPYGSLTAAKIRARKEGGVTAAVHGGWVVRVPNSGGDQPAALERLNDRGTADAKQVPGLPEGKSGTDQGDAGLEVPRQRMMLGDMLGTTHDDEIVRRVIERIPVNVVDMLFGAKGPTKDARHNIAVLQDAVLAAGKNPVSTDINVAADAVMRAVTGVATELGSSKPDPVSTAGERASAMDAGKDPVGGKVSAAARLRAEQPAGLGVGNVPVGFEDAGAASGTVNDRQVNSPTRIDKLGPSSGATNDGPSTVDPSSANGNRPDGKPAVAPSLTPGKTIVIDGAKWVVESVGESTVGLKSDDGLVSRTVTITSKTYQKIKDQNPGVMRPAEPSRPVEKQGAENGEELQGQGRREETVAAASEPAVAVNSAVAKPKPADLFKTPAERVETLLAKDRAEVRSAMAPEQAPAAQAAAILDAAAEPPKGAERLSVIKDVKSGAVTPEEVAAAYPAKEEAGAAPAAPAGHIEADAALWSKLTDGTATPDEFRAGFDAWLSNKDAIKAEMLAKKKDDLLKMGGAHFAWRYKSENKPEIADALWREGMSAYTLGRGYSYSMGSGSQERAVRAMVEATDADQLAAYAQQRKAAQEEAVARVAKAAEAIKDPKTLDDFKLWMRATMSDGKSAKDARLMLTPEQRAEFDRLAAEQTRSTRKTADDDRRATVRAAGQTTTGEIIATKHTRDGHDLWVVRLADRVSRDDYTTLLAGAKKLGGSYSSFRGNGAVPGFQFRTPDAAKAFLALAGGDTATASEAVQERRDAFEDDRSQSAAERLNEMADRIDELASDSLGRERKANTERRARFAANAEADARSKQAMAATMRNIAGAIIAGTANMLDRVRQKVQVEYLRGVVHTANDAMLRERSGSYAAFEKVRGTPPTVETADFAEFPSYTAMRSDLARLGRQLLEVDGTKTLGKKLMTVADDVSDAFTAFSKEPGNLHRLAVFTTKGGGLPGFSTKEAAERAIARSGYKGRAIAWTVKRGEHTIIMSPSEAMTRGIWRGDGDSRVTLNPEFGAELVESIGRANRRGARVSVPWQFETAHDRRKMLARMGIETPAEFRSALREFIALQERPEPPSRVKELERALVGRRNDGLDFFPTPEATADEMVAAADIQPGMRVLEPSGGMGHIADRIRAAGHEPEVIEIEGDKRELLEAKGFNLVGRDFLDFNDANHAERGATFGDLMRAPDGTVGILRGQGGMGSGRVRLVSDEAVPRELGKFNFSELSLVERRGVGSGYDRIVMNPPFSNGRDIEHVRHAYGLLKPGGRLVAIMGESAFSNQSKRATEFREWLDSIGGTDEKLADGTFNDPRLPVTTGANARMVVIDKSAIGNAGTFDQANADIRFDRQDDYTSTDEQGTADTSIAGRVSMRVLERSVAGAERTASDAGDVHPYVARVLPQPLADIAAVFGQRLQGFAIDPVLSQTDRKRFGFFNGVFTKGRIFLRDGGHDRPHLAVLGHELAHSMARDNPALYARFVDAVRAYIDQGKYAQFAKSSVAAGLDQNGIREEFMGEILSDAFMDRGFWESLGAKNRGLLSRVAGMVKRMVGKILETVGYDQKSAPYLKDFRAVMDIAADVMSEYGLSKMAERILVEDALVPNTGSAAEDALINGATDKAASLLLAEDGIKGIKYLDGTSRGAGEGSHNYVIFHGDDIGIVDAKFNRTIQRNARDVIADVMGSAGAKVSWWDKTIATQYAKAQRMPAFKRVFDHVQQYIEDVSTLANQSADNAPSILPKLEKWSDWKNTGLNKQDSEAIAAPIFTGTLQDERVYDDDELRSRFRLTDAQIEQYKEFRRTVDSSLDQVVAADVIRLLGDKNPGLRELAIEDRQALRDGVLEYLDGQIEQNGEDPSAPDEEAGQWTQLKRDISAKYDRADDLKAKGYAPLSRFGKYAVNVADSETGESLFFGLYESRRAANKAARQLKEDPQFDGAVHTQDVLSQEQYKLFQQVPMESLEMFAEAIGAQDSEVFQAYLKLAKNNRSALKRMIHRKGTAGFSEDVPRVLASFVTSNARMASSALNMGAATAAVQDIAHGDVKDEAWNLVDSVSNPQDRAGAVRGLMFANFIGGSLASAAVNMTQPLTMTLPYLSQWGGAAKASGRMMAAAKAAATGKTNDVKLGIALRKAERDGIVSPQEIHHLTAQAMGSWGANPILKRMAFAWSAPFSLAEQFNRRASFIAAYNTAREEGIEDPFSFAENAVIETQGLYNTGNMPALSRSTIGASVMTFRQFSIHYMEWLARMWRAGPEGKRAVGYALAILILMAGTDGLPFADDVDDLVDTLGQAMGYDVNSKRARREFVAKTLGFGDEAADVVARGFSAAGGIPMDVSLRMSMGNLLPGTGLLLRSNTDKSGDLLEFAGPAGGLAKQYMTAAAAGLRGDATGVIRAATPVAIQNVIKAAEMWATGEARDQLGRKVMDVDEADAAVKALGFNPAPLARESQKLSMIRRSEQLAKNVEGEIASEWARARLDGDSEGVADARQKLRDWNENNPDNRIEITGSQIIRRVRELRKTREQRFITSVSKERRRQVEEAIH